MMASRNPRETVFRKVLLYPATEDKPQVILKEFSKEGANHPHGFYTTALDLRPHYRKHINDTRIFHIDIINQPEKVMEGRYAVYFNINIRLPLNRCAARVVGIDPKRPGPKPFYRGDIFVVKQQEWPGPRVMGGGAHMDWLDFPSEMVACIEEVMKNHCETNLETLIEQEKDFSEASSESIWLEFIIFIELGSIQEI